MTNYDKLEVKNSLSLNNIFELLDLWGGEPQYTPFGIISSTICHNMPGLGSRKLYYYDNSQLFQCYTRGQCFDIFELLMKVNKIQHNIEIDLNEAVRWIAARFGIEGSQVEDLETETEDWNKFAAYDRILEIKLNERPEVVLKEYNLDILDHFNYEIKIAPWLKEGIGQEAMNQARIGFYPGGDQITIPHFDKNNRFIGLRGRTLCQEDAELFGKYRPLKINKLLYNHPLGMNLYNLNFSKDNIKKFKKAIILESEKSTLLYKTYFGLDRDISVACCGSSISTTQIELLLEAGAEEIIIALDRQFQCIGDDEFQHLKSNLIRTRNKYKNYVNISFIFDKHMITQYKASPLDESKEKFLQLFKERIFL